jgi:hypothetical protein
MQFSKWLQLDEGLALKGSYKGGFFQRLVAAKYVMAPSNDESARPAFEDLVKKIERQSNFLKSKFDFEPTQDDPYHSMKAMTKDIERQKAQGQKPRIPVYAEPPAMDGNSVAGEGHPFLTNKQNVTQRGVHDIIAHYFGQHPFSARGEYAAYNRHLKTLCNVQQAKSGECLAAKAMFTEVVAQTSYYYVYGGYAKQKAVILHDFDHYHVGLLAPNSPLNKYFVVEGKLMVPASDFSYAEFKVEQSELCEEMARQLNGKSITTLAQLPGESPASVEANPHRRAI